jgi:hypothetical protein
MSAIVVLVLTSVIVAVSHGTGEVVRRQGGAIARRSPLSSTRSTPRAPRAEMTALQRRPGDTRR